MPAAQFSYERHQFPALLFSKTLCELRHGRAIDAREQDSINCLKA